MKHIIARLSFGVLFLGATVFTHPANAQSADKEIGPAQMTKIDVQLKGYLFGIRVMKTDIRAAMTDHEYSIFADLHTSGLGAFLKKFKIWSFTRGRFDATTLRPQTHLQQNLDKKNRRVQMRYGPDALDISIVPRLGSQGKPPATPSQRFKSHDTLSAVLNIMVRGYRTHHSPCTGKIPVFDSKQHYYLRMEHVGTKRLKHKGFKGDTIKCNIYYEAVSGYDPEDLPSAEESAAPVVVFLAHYPEHKLYFPVRASYKISGFKAIIKARDIKISTLPANQFIEYGDTFLEQETKLRSLGILNTQDYDQK